MQVLEHDENMKKLKKIQIKWPNLNIFLAGKKLLQHTAKSAQGLFHMHFIGVAYFHVVEVVSLPPFFFILGLACTTLVLNFLSMSVYTVFQKRATFLFLL